MHARKLLLVGLALTSLAACTEQSSDDRGTLSLALGSVLQTRTTTTLHQVAVRDAVSSTKHTLVGTTSEAASFAIETRADDGSMNGASIDLPLKAHIPKAEECPGMTVKTDAATCAVAAGTFECTKTLIELKQGDVTRSVETWVAAGIPVPIRSEVKNESLTTVTELVALNAPK